MVEKRGMDNRSISKHKINYNLSSKKGQITIFIIIGIILLFTFAAILYFTQRTAETELRAEVEPVLAEVHQTFRPVQTYTDNCILQVGKRGLKILGEQGGYIYPDLAGSFSALHPTEADGIEMSSLKIPYWHYNFNSNPDLEIKMRSLKPYLYIEDDPEMSVEAQLQRFVDEKLDSCLANYSIFSGQGIDVTRLEPQKEVKVAIGQDSVNFLVKMKIQAKKVEESFEIRQFYVKIPLNLKHYYEVADEITQIETNYSFLEMQALDLIATYSGVDRERLPPTEAVTFETIPKVFWVENDIKEKLKGLLLSQVPMLRYLGSENFYRYDYLSSGAVQDLSELYQKNYDNTILPLELGQDLETSFDYFGWEPYVDLNDVGGMIKPSSYGASFSRLNFYTQHYYTTYDLSYPVLVTLHDSDALDGEGYNFVFALESNIRNNNEVKSGDVLPAPVARVKTMVCDENKRNTELLKTVVIDASSREPLEAVQIGFSIPEEENCMMGFTDSAGEFSSKYPALYGGVIDYIREGYLTNFYPIDTYNYKKEGAIIGYALSEANPNQRVVEMYPYKKINVSVKKRTINKCSYAHDIICGGNKRKCFMNSDENLLTSPEELGEPLFEILINGSRNYKQEYYWMQKTATLAPSEEVTFMLERVSDIHPEISGEDFFSSFKLQGSGIAETELVPGVYKVTAMLSFKDQLIAPEHKRCFEYEVVGLHYETCSKMEEQVLDEVITGMVKWESPENYLVITSEQLYSSNKIEFFVPNYEMVQSNTTYSVSLTTCGGVGCWPSGGCLYSESFELPGILPEELAIMTQLSDPVITNKMRPALEPVYK